MVVRCEPAAIAMAKHPPSPHQKLAEVKIRDAPPSSRAQARTRRSSPFFGCIRPSESTVRLPPFEMIGPLGAGRSIPLGIDGDRVTQAEGADLLVFLFTCRVKARRSAATSLPPRN
jgi:hypothetical protein